MSTFLLLGARIMLVDIGQHNTQTYHRNGRGQVVSVIIVVIVVSVPTVLHVFVIISVPAVLHVIVVVSVPTVLHVFGIVSVDAVLNESGLASNQISTSTSRDTITHSLRTLRGRSTIRFQEAPQKKRSRTLWERYMGVVLSDFDKHFKRRDHALPESGTCA